jgi:phospholipid transport system substrate-binding protein
MLTRRTLLLSLPALAAFASVPAASAQSPAQATQFINTTAKQIIAIIDSGAGQAEKSAQLQQLIDRSVAVDRIAQFCLGRYARTATPAQRTEYERLFHHVLLESITGHLGEYKGITYTLSRPVAGEGGIQVPSVVQRPGAASANLTWVVADIGGQPKIIDLIAEGTSLKVTQRSDYSSFLDSHSGNVDALIEAMKRQARRMG